MSPTPPTVVLMLKAPVVGEVKTRLGREIGFDAAATVYRRLVEHQFRQLPPGWPVRVCYAPAEAESAMRAWLGNTPEYTPQRGHGLGQRLQAAMDEHFAQRDSPVCFIGGDCPGLLTARFLEVEALLHQNDAVIVPALDGGYTLLTLARPCAEVFLEITWSTEVVLEQTRARLRNAGVSWAETAPLEDVDDATSWQRALATFPELAP